MALTVKMMSSGDVMLTYLHLTTAVAALRVGAASRAKARPPLSVCIVRSTGRSVSKPTQSGRRPLTDGSPLSSALAYRLRTAP